MFGVRVIPRLFNRGYSQLFDAAKTSARVVALTGAVVLSSSDSSANTTHALAEDTAMAILSPAEVDGKQGHSLNDGRTVVDQEMLSSQLINLELDLYHSNGQLNKSSILLTNPELLEKLVEFATSTELEVDEKLRINSRDLLTKVLTASFVNHGSCPDEVKDLIRASSLSDPKDPKAKAQKAIAITKLITSVNNRFFYMDSKSALGNYISKIPNGFYGQVGNVMASFVEKTMSDFLANPNELLQDSDLDLEPGLKAQLTNALGEMFMSSVIKPMRDDDLVKKAQKLLIAYEEHTRDESSSLKGIEEARKDFIESITKQRCDIAKLNIDTLFLSSRKAEIEGALAAKSRTFIHRDFCTSGEINGSSDDYIFVQPTQAHIRNINNAIVQKQKAIHDISEQLERSKHVIGFALESCVSPTDNSNPGLRDLFFERLIGRKQDEKLESEEQNLADILLGNNAEEDYNFDFSQLHDPKYGVDFTGVKKLTLVYLKEKYQELLNEKELIKKFNLQYADDKETIQHEFYDPLRDSLPITIFTTKDVDAYKAKLAKFCHSPAILEDFSQKMIAYQRGLNNIVFKKLIHKTANGWEVNTKLVNSLLPDGQPRKNLVRGLDIILRGMKSDPNFSSPGFQPSLNKSAPVISTLLKLLERNADKFPTLPLNNDDEANLTEAQSFVSDFEQMLNNHDQILFKIVEAVKYELSVSKDSVIAKISSIDLDERFLETVNSHFDLARFLIDRDRVNDAKLKKIDEMLDPENLGFQSSWEAEMKRPKFSTKIGQMMVDDFVQMGMGKTQVLEVIGQMEDIQTLLPSSEDQSFVIIINEILKSIISYLKDTLGKIN
jgi:hypothetical protein